MTEASYVSVSVQILEQASEFRVAVSLQQRCMNRMFAERRMSQRCMNRMIIFRKRFPMRERAGETAAQALEQASEFRIVFFFEYLA